MAGMKLSRWGSGKGGRVTEMQEHVVTIRQSGTATFRVYIDNVCVGRGYRDECKALEEELKGSAFKTEFLFQLMTGPDTIRATVE